MNPTIDSLVAALEAAQNGLRWYQDMYPLAGSCADDEMHEQIDAALAQPPSAEVQGLDSVRFEWWFSKEPKYEFFDQYMEGVSAGWSLDQWRTAIDAAMAADIKDTP